jgi:hypothetical protein
VTLAVTGNTNFGQGFRRHRVPAFQWHRLPLTGSRWDTQWLIARRTKPTLCVFSVCLLCLTWRLWKSVVSPTVTKNSFFGRVFERQWVPVFERHPMPLTVSRWNIRWLIGHGKTPTFCVFPVFSVAVLEKCCDACGDEEYYFRSDF